MSHSAELPPKQINIEQKYGKKIFVGPPAQLGHITEHCAALFTSLSLFTLYGLEDEHLSTGKCQGYLRNQLGSDTGREQT